MLSGCKLTSLCCRCDQIVGGVLFGHTLPYMREVTCQIGNTHGELTTARTEHEINLQGAPYVLLVLMTDVVSEGLGKYMHLRNLISVSLFPNIKFEVDEDSGDICMYALIKIFHTSLAVFM